VFDVQKPTHQSTRRRSLIAGLICFFLISPLAAEGRCQTGLNTQPTSAETKKRTIFGVVIEQRKYSIRIASGMDDIEIAIPDKTPIDQRLDRPRIDLASNVVLQELLASQEPGSAIPVEVQENLPEPLGLMAEFAHISERRRIMSEHPKKFIRYRLLPFDQLPSEPENELLLTGKVISVDERGQLVLRTDTEELLAELGNRDGRLGARTIADLRPLESEVEIQADQIDGKWVAQSVLYRRVKLTSAKTPGEPLRVLVLGDEVSLSYLNSFRNKLGRAYHVHHPPENCRGSANWERLPMWLGPYRQPGYQWDVIVFNLGLGDLNTDTTAYQAALQEFIPPLRATGAQLIWVSTTPLPKGWEGTIANAGRKIPRAEAQAKIKELNAAALTAIEAAESIPILDLSAEMEPQLETSFATWWAGKSPMLGRELGDWVAEKIAQTLQGPPVKDEDK
jgi:acyl-CoA thioesterase-1